MRIHIYIILLAFVGANAQTSIGIKNPENVSPVTNYRVPDWSYSTLRLGANGSMSGNRNSSTEQNAGEYSDESSNFSLAGAYLYFRESEEQTFNMETRVTGTFGQQSSKIPYYSAADRESENEDRGGTFSLDGEWRRYILKNHFIHLTLMSELSAKRKTNDEKQTGLLEKSGTDDRIGSTTEMNLGYGFGRIRNVTPLIRALRIRERLKALDRDIDLDENKITKMAQHFAKFSGYQRVYDRQNKNFWGDFADIAGLDALAPYEQFYIEDVLKENIGQRFQGWSLSLGAFYRDNRTKNENEQNNKSRMIVRNDYVETYSFTKRTSDTRFLGPYLSAQWVKNLTLRHQLGFSSDVQWTVLLKDEAYSYTQVNDRETEWRKCGKQPENLYFLFAADYLWVLHDRLLWTNRIDAAWTTNFYDVDGFEPRTGVQEVEPNDRGFIHDYLLQSKFSYYIENDLVLSTDIQLNRSDRRTTGFTCRFGDASNTYWSRKWGEWNWEYWISLTYYLDRKLL